MAFRSTAIRRLGTGRACPLNRPSGLAVDGPSANVYGHAPGGAINISTTRRRGRCSTPQLRGNRTAELDSSAATSGESRPARGRQLLPCDGFPVVIENERGPPFDKSNDAFKNVNSKRTFTATPNLYLCSGRIVNGDRATGKPRSTAPEEGNNTT
jgi:hypothetical protein